MPIKTAAESPSNVAVKLLLGGVRAGKSAKALQLAHDTSGSAKLPVLFVATAQAFDSEMTRRIEAHRAERPVMWSTLEEPIDLVEAISERLTHEPTIAVVVIDCITLWVSNLLLQHESVEDIEQLVALETEQLVAMMSTFALASIDSRLIARQWIVVSNEVGLGVVPPTPLGRQYRDALGRANQILARAANDVRLLVAGVEMQLKAEARP